MHFFLKFLSLIKKDNIDIRYFSVLLLTLATSLQAFSTVKKAEKTQPIVNRQPVEAIPSSNAINNTCPLINSKRIQVNKTMTNRNNITIVSKNSSIAKNQLAQFSGGVIMISKDQRITAEQLTFNRAQENFNAQGNIHYQSNNIDVFSQSITANNAQKSTILTKSSYQLANNPAHGKAEQLAISATGDLTLRNSSFTTCQTQQPDWLLEASKIYISTQKNTGEAYNAKLKFFGIPVFYIPYFSFPVTPQRKSGFLYPKLGSSNRSGFIMETPYYVNIADNMDATLTPRYMSKRGIELLSQFRYLSDLQSGSIDFEYLNKDQSMKSNNSRYLARIQHVGTFADNFRIYADYTTISDDNYLADIKSTNYNSNDAYLYQIGELSYFAKTWQTSIKLQDFEVIGNHVQSYRTVPQIEFSSFHYLPLLHSNFDIYSEFSRFQTPDLNLPQANRYHVEAGFTIPINHPAWFFNSEIKLLQTYYQQDRIEHNQKLAKTVSRTLPKIRLHGGINLDRNIHYFGHLFSQTLEPQIQYLYIPHKDQSNIGMYDTTALQDDYNGLFRERRFSGLDRIAQANQFSWGLTSRLLNKNNQEIFRLSIGKILYLNNSNILTVNNRNFTTNQSALAGDIFYQINNELQFSGDIQYDTVQKSTIKSTSKVDFQYSKNHLLELNHRFSRNISGNRIEQISLLTSGNINQSWQFIGRLTQDLVNRRSIESYAGLQYESCCWAIRFAYHRSINSQVDRQQTANDRLNKFDSGFVIQFVIKGLGGQQSSVGIEDMFNSSIFGYKRPYFLNN